MKKKTYLSEQMNLGAQTLAASLVLGSTAIYAAPVEEKCDVKKDQQCESAEAIERIEVHGVRNSIYHVDKSGDLRRVNDLVDTPQVINILTQDQIQESGKTDLKDILSAQSGVTLGTGENGNAFGDRYIIRGHEARSDVFVDGLRDPGMTTRESFATERVEITKGPSSTFAGRGSSGGAVNSVTKKASTSYNFGRVDASFGTDDYYRLTADYNASINDDAAVRINLLSAEDTKPGRDGIERSRKGAQLSGVYQANDKLNFIADFYYLSADDRPDLGSYFDQTTRKPVSDIPVYAQDEDFQESEVSTFTLRTEYEINDDLMFYNSTRFGKTENGYITTGARGTTRDASDTAAPGAASINLSTHQGWQEVEYFATQFNLISNITALGKKHKLVYGLEFTDEKVDNGFYNYETMGDSNCRVAGRGGVSDSYCLLDANGSVVQNASSLMQRAYTQGDSDAIFEINTVSAYVMDTIELTDETQLFLGLRQDSFDYSNDTSGRSGDVLYEYEDDMYNGHIGLLHSITEDGNVYINFSTATNINGGESDLGANCGYGGICGDPDQAQNADPEIVENIEIGTKWQLFDHKFMATAAVFQMTKKDVMESVGDSYSTLGTLNTGKNRVKGVEFGLVGDINEQLSMQFSATSMTSEVLESYNEDNVGLALSNFADKSLYLQLRYQPTETFSFGGDYSYQSEMFGGQPDTAAGYDSENDRYSIVVPSYQVVNLFANYNATEDVTLRLNIGNVLDKEYWTAAYRSGAFMYLGDARSVRFTMNYQF
ncbi:TonB-dependent receptor [Psychrosphaera sp.]|nr:TonB-dependent receptor [Psychrosphaera sp.]